MRTAELGVLLAVVSAAVAVAGCSSRCITTRDCPSGQRCRGGTCLEPAGGPDASNGDGGDAGSDADMDPGDGGRPDADTDRDHDEEGPADAEVGCRSDEECEACWRCDVESGECVIADAETPCDSGRCYHGTCCGGCWTGSVCLAGEHPTACGVGGAPCEVCPCPDSGCPAGACEPPLAVTSLSLGIRHACAVASDHTLWCWGWNGSGALGIDPSGTTMESLAPTQVGTETDWQSVSVGNEHTCGVQTDGSLWCWGANGDRQLGLGDTGTRFVPTLLPGGPWLAVHGAIGGDTTCARSADDLLHCWGRNNHGQVGFDTSGDVEVPTPTGDATWADATLGRLHGCGVRRDGTLWCWGDNRRGALGVGDALVGDTNVLPLQVGRDSDWATVAALERGTCALKSDGARLCWGDNDLGQLGIGNTADQPEPAGLPSETGSWSAVAGGATHAGGLQPPGILLFWGDNDHGQLGLGIAAPFSASPQSVGLHTDWELVAAGGDFSCGTRRGGGLHCFGFNDDGQLGLGNILASETPQPVCLITP